MEKYNSLELFGYITYKNNQLIDTLLKSINLVYNMDNRRQVLLDCVYRELMNVINTISDIISTYSEEDVPVHNMIDECLHPSDVSSKCNIQAMFVDLVKYNSVETIDRISFNMNRSTLERIGYINDIYDDLKLLIEDVYISAAAIDIKCDNFNKICDSSVCDKSIRGSSIILYVTSDSDKISTIIKEYVKICKNIIDPMTISMIIDFGLIFTNTNDVNIDIDCTDLPETIILLKEYFVNIEIRNSRPKSINIDHNTRDLFRESNIAFI